MLVITPRDRDYSDLPGIRLTPGVPVRMGMNLITPKDAKGTYLFDLVRVSSKQIIGGVTYQMEIKPA